jgi:hypothetical protein
MRLPTQPLGWQPNTHGLQIAVFCLLHALQCACRAAAASILVRSMLLLLLLLLLQ